MSSWEKTLILAAALKTNIFTSLNFSQTAKQVSTKLSLDPRATSIMLEALLILGYLTKAGDYYELTAMAKQIKPNTILHSARLIESWLNLDKAITTGKPQSKARNENELEIFLGAMAEGSSDKAKELVEICLKENSQAKNIIDVGGGPGVYALEFAKRGLKATLYDLPAVIDLAKNKIKGIHFISGDFNEWLPNEKFDIVLLSNICHIYNPQKVKSLFRRSLKIMTKNASLVLVDFVKGISPRAEVFAVNMLVNTSGGGCWSKEQYEQWLKESGLKLTKLYNLGNDNQQLIVAK